MAVLRPFKVQPFIIWAIIIAIVIMVVYASKTSNYQPRGSVKESVYDAPSTLANGPPLGTLGISPTETVPSQIPADAPIPPIQFRPDLFPRPADRMTDYDQSNLTLQPLDSIGKQAVRMIPLNEADDSMYPATLDDLFAASEQQGFMESSVDTLYDVMALTPPRLMTDQV